MRTKNFSLPRTERGVALVIVLAFVVLLTGLVVAYFSRSMDNRQISSSSFTEAKVDELARSALDIVTGDLKQEIVNGSTIQNPQPGIYPNIYLSSSNAFMVPARSGTSIVPKTWSAGGAAGGAANSTLIRISGTGAIAFPGVDHVASNALSSGTSANGRSITLSRWNQHYLLPLASANSVPDTTPDLNFSAPAWIYVTGTGGPCTPPLTSLTAAGSGAIGRYAYAIYDEGALLDANTVGFPAESSTMPAQYVAKGSLAFADLTTLTPRAPTQTGINNLVGWRSYASMRNLTTQAQPTGAFPFLIFTGSTSMPTAYKNMVLSNTNGFVTVSNTASGGLTDQSFLTRQELINFVVNAIGKVNFNPNNLYYLGTFNRAVAAPSWSPEADAGNGFTYKTNAESSTITISGSSVPNPNRDIANVRFTTPGTITITHYNDGVITSGSMVSPPSSSTYNVNAGDSLMQSRFSLSKIAWLSQANPDTGVFTDPTSAYAPAIQACFGLKWGVVGAANGGNACWSYIGSNNNFAGTIETLDQVAAEGREPNFFEVLKASILNGSVGVSPGIAAYKNGTVPTFTRGSPYPGANAGCDNMYAYSFDRAGTVPAPAGISDMQIMQIGANIIDQYDADSYPTAIYFKYLGLTAAFDAAVSGNQNYGTVDMVYGDENLPNLMGMFHVNATVDGLPLATSGTGPTAGLAQWWQPEIWNIHQMPNPANSSVAPPKNFQIQGYGQIKFVWSFNGAPPAGFSPSSGSSSPQTLEGNQWINFTDNNPTQSSLYATPYLLTQNTVPGITATTSMPEMSGSSSFNTNINHVSQNPFVGFYAGIDSKYIGIPLPWYFVNPRAETGGCVTFCLGWLDSSNKFHPYSYEPGLFIWTYGVIDNGASKPQAGALPSDSDSTNHVLVDPRTTRFANTHNWQCPDTGFTYFPNNSSHKLEDYGWGIPAASNFVYTGTNQYGYFICDWAANSLTPLSQNSATVTYYSDPDGIVRPGDGVFGNAATGDGMMLYSGTGTTNGVAGTGGTAQGDTVAATTVAGSGANKTGNTFHGRRPVILNRPFRSTGELGYVFRDLPFKSLDFFTTSSADAALLDAFSLSDQTRIVGNQLNSVIAGQINVSNAPYPALRAILSGASKKDFDPAYNTSSAIAQTIAQNIARELNPATGGGPLSSRASLVTRLGAVAASGTGPIINGINASFTSTDRTNKAYIEAPLRALADVTNTRTWNLMIDVIAQTGNFTSNGTDLNKNFIVQGEKRYWLHIAIDRLTGKVIDEQLEPVYE